MSTKNSQQVSVKAAVVGIVTGAAFSILFAAMGSPGLMGVGAAIGASIATALNQREIA